MVVGYSVSDRRIVTPEKSLFDGAVHDRLTVRFGVTLMLKLLITDGAVVSIITSDDVAIVDVLLNASIAIMVYR